jgi:type II secretory pathway pseudopilin PulG
VILAVAASSSTSAWDEPGTIAFLVIFGMAVVLYFVFRSLVKQLKKVNEAARREAQQAEEAQQAKAAGANGFPAPGGVQQAASAPPGDARGDRVADAAVTSPPSVNGQRRDS